MYYKDKRGCTWSLIKVDDNNPLWGWYLKKTDNQKNKLYLWKPKRIKNEWLELII